MQLLESLSFKKVLKRGYSFVEDENGNVISSIKKAVPGADIKIHFVDGAADAAFTGKDKPAKPKKAAKTPKPAGQGQLF